MTPARRLFAIDLRSLALFRMSLAAWILVDLALRVKDLTAFLCDGGLVPAASVLAHAPPALTLWSLYLFGGTPVSQAVVAGLQATCAVLLFVGFRTRFATFASWLFLVSLDARLPLVTHGFDTLAQLLAFWAMFVPLGAALSVDRLIANEETEPGRADEPTEISTGTIALMSQLVMLYVFAGLHKLRTPIWQDGTAVALSLSIPELQRAPGAWIAARPQLAALLNHAVLWLEILGPAALFSPVLHVPLRVGAMLGFFLLHVGLGSCMMLGLFPIISTIALVPFLPTEAWERFPKLERALAALVTPAARVFRRFAGGRPRFVLSPAERVLVAFLALYVAVWNLATLDRDFLSAVARRRVPLSGRAYRPPHPACWLGFVLHLNQAMTMFTSPDGSSEWLVVGIEFADGTRGDYYLDLGRLVETRPDGHRRFSLMGQRWGAFMGEIAGYPWAHTHVGAYLCRLFKSEHPEHAPPARVLLYRVHQRSPGDPRSNLSRQTVIEHLCRVEDGELEP